VSGTLFVVPTPLGNLEDMTLRAIRVLKEVHLIAAEDTRHSRVLLKHFAIDTKLVSYHQHSKQTRLPVLLQALESGDVAIISDAGMPTIADPGFELVRAAVDAGFAVDVLPGPSAVVTAATLAALPARGFVLMGFLPRVRAHFIERLQEVANLSYSLVIFEAPSRVVQTLTLSLEVLGERPAVATRELSKLHQEVMRGTLGSILDQCQNRELRGEWTLVVGPCDSPPDPADPDDILSNVERLIAVGETPRDAIRLVAELAGVKRSHVYQIWLAGRRVEDVVEGVDRAH
jgi:16S rRNA (cytidine1402-2'-O)-methyltransferase